MVRLSLRPKSVCIFTLSAMLTAGAVSSYAQSDGDLLAERLGSTHAKGRYHFTGGDFLNEGADKILETGMRIIKVYFLRPHEFYPWSGSWPSFSSLADTAQDWRYQNLFNKSFHTYVITAYSLGRGEHYWRSGVSSSEANDERQQFYDLAAHLYTTYNGTGKTFILSHWEGDWALRGNYDPSSSGDPGSTAVNGMITWLNARQDGVNQARAAFGSTSDVKVYHAAEVNLVHVARENPSRPLMTNSVLPYTYCDLYSYSAYDTIGGASADPSLTWGRLNYRYALDYLEQKAPDSATFGSQNVYLGEFGWPCEDSSTDPGATDAKQMLVVRMATEESLAHDLQYILYWQVYDNESSNSASGARGFYLIRPDGSLAMPWIYFNALLPQSTYDTAIQNPSFEDYGGTYNNWEVATTTSGEIFDLPLTDNSNGWGVTTSFGSHFAGKITSGLTADFTIGQVVDTDPYTPGSMQTDYQLSAYVHLHCRDWSNNPIPYGVHQIWEIGWNDDGSRPTSVMSCDYYQTVGFLDGNFTGNSQTAFSLYQASGSVPAGVEALAIRVRLYNDGAYAWSHLNLDNVTFAAQTVATTPPPTITTAVSRKAHGLAGTFDINVDAGGAMEPRADGPTQVVVTFDQPIQGVGGLDPSDVFLASGTVSGIFITGNELTLNIAGASNATPMAISFGGITNADGVATSEYLCFDVMHGDVSGDRAVGIFDLLDVRNALNQPVATGNFIRDINADGQISIFDLLDVRNQMGVAYSGSCP